MWPASRCERVKPQLSSCRFDCIQTLSRTAGAQRLCCTCTLYAIGNSVRLKQQKVWPQACKVSINRHYYTHTTGTSARCETASLFERSRCGTNLQQSP